MDELGLSNSQQLGSADPSGGLKLATELNAIFDACHPSVDDEVSRTSLLNALIDKYKTVNSNPEDTAKLLSIFELVLNPSQSRVKREVFLRLMNINSDGKPLNLTGFVRPTPQHRGTNILRMRKENVALFEELISESQTIQALKDEEERLKKNLHEATEKVQAQLKLKQMNHEKIDAMEYAISEMEVKSKDLADKLSEFQLKHKMASEHEKNLESKLEEINMEIEELKGREVQLLHRVECLASNERELRSQVNALNEEQSSQPVTTEDSFSSDVITIDLPNDLSKKLNGYTFFCHQHQDTSDAATDVTGLIVTKHAATLVCAQSQDSEKEKNIVRTSIEERQANQHISVTSTGSQAEIVVGDTSTQTSTLMVKEQSSNTEETADVVRHKKLNTECHKKIQRRRDSVFATQNCIRAFLVAFIVYICVLFLLSMPDLSLYMRGFWRPSFKGPPPS